MMATQTESKSIVSLHELDGDESFSASLEQLSICPTNLWNEKVHAMLENSSLNAIAQDLEYYVKSLKKQQNETKDKLEMEQLNTQIWSHLQIIKVKLHELRLDFNSLIARLLEQVLSIFGTLELNILEIVYKNNEFNDSKELHACGKQILSKLKHTFRWTELNVVHCLLQMKFDRRSSACVEIMKYMYKHVLFTSRITNHDDVTLCGYYLLFCKYRRFISSSDHNPLLRKLFERFDKKASYLNNFNMLHDILNCSQGNEVDHNSVKGRVEIVTSYFKYIRDREKSCTDQEADKNKDDSVNLMACDENYNQEKPICEDIIYENNEENFYESSKDERIITFVDSSDLDPAETENDSDCKHDEKKIYLIGANEVEEPQLNSEMQDDESGRDASDEQSLDCTQDKGFFDNTEVSFNIINVHEEGKDNSPCDGYTDNISNTVQPCSNKEVAGEQPESINVHGLHGDKEAVCEIETGDLINQLQEYLTISTPEKPPHLMNMGEEECVDYSEPLNLDTSEQTTCKRFLQMPEGIYHPPHREPNYLKMGNAAFDESSNYLFEFGYETPPKDGNCEQDFNMVPVQEHRDSEDISENGFLTPENETVCNLLPDPYISQATQFNGCVDCLGEQIKSEQYKESPIFYNASTSSAPTGILTFVNDAYRETFDEKTLDLSRNTSRNKCEHAFTFNGATKIQKYLCNDELIGNLTMPSAKDMLLETTRVPQSEIIKSASLRESKKQLISSLDMDIGRAFAELNRKPNRSKNKTRSKPIIPAALKCNGISTTDPKLFKMKPVVDLSSFRPIELDRNEKANQQQESIAAPTNDIKIETKEDSDADILKAIHKDNYTEEELSLLVQAVKCGTETRLPFKKRRMTVPEEETTEISYPATPMVSIAELAAMQSNNGRGYLSEMQLEPAPLGVEVNYNLNAYPYDFVPCVQPFFEVNSQQHVQQYCVDGFDRKENLDMSQHYFHGGLLEP